MRGGGVTVEKCPTVQPHYFDNNVTRSVGSRKSRRGWRMQWDRRRLGGGTGAPHGGEATVGTPVGGGRRRKTGETHESKKRLLWGGGGGRKKKTGEKRHLKSYLLAERQEKQLRC